jgi:hypothetical protein
MKRTNISKSSIMLININNNPDCPLIEDEFDWTTLDDIEVNNQDTDTEESLEIHHLRFNLIPFPSVVAR